jgi:alpha-tubulin suppressor-like RCC1 family protein
MISNVRVRLSAAAMLCAVLVGGCTDDPVGPHPAEPAAIQPLIVPLQAGFIQLSLGGGHTCALNATRVVECWGFNSLGPAPPETSASTGWFTQISAGSLHACALRNDGAVECWGDDVSGAAPALKQATVGSFTRVSVFGNSSCGHLDGAIECWGGLSSSEAPPLVTATAGVFTQVDQGGSHGCAVRDDGVIECWGANADGQAPATKTAASGWFTQVSAGSQHTCAVRNDGIIECWGWNTWDSAPPTRVPAAGSFVQVDAEIGTCGLRDDGEVECWGYDPCLPTGQSPTSGSFVQIGVGQTHVCSLRDDGVIECAAYPIVGYEDYAPPFRYATTHVLRTATFNAPVAENEGGTIGLSLTGALVPGYPSATSFTYAFDCGDGNGYGAFEHVHRLLCRR